MAVRKTIEEVVVVDGNRDSWLTRCEAALHAQGFTGVAVNPTLLQLEGNYKKATVWGSLLVSLMPSGENATSIVMRATANIDNVFALFSSPGQKIVNRFKEGL